MSKAGFYSLEQVAKMLSVSEAQVRAFVRAGFVTPAVEGFSFQQLVLLRTAKGLHSAKVPATRMKQALKKLRDQLPEGRPLTTVTISAEAGRVVVRDEKHRWRPEDGQLLFDFEVRDLAKKVQPLARKNVRAAMAQAPQMSADDWYALGCELELGSIDEARDSYRRAIELDPQHADAHCNLGRLLHEAGQREAARAHYERALDIAPEHPTVLFNLGVALEDAGASHEAVEMYERAVKSDPSNADAHFNAARLYQSLDRPILALRHLRAYEKLKP